MKLGDYLKQTPLVPRALVVQGGGMRAVYSMAALAVLNEAGLTNSFSLAVGSSAGAINASYFLTDDAKEGTSVYVDYLSNRRFINPLRLKRILDVDYLVDTVLRPHGVFTDENLKTLPAKLQAFVSCAATGIGQVFSNEDDVDWYDVLHASSAVPYLYNGKIKIGGQYYIDGAVSEPLPVRHAIDQGCEEVLAVATRPIGYRSKGRTTMERYAMKAIAKGVAEPVHALIVKANNKLNAELDILQGITPVEGVKTWTISPSRSDLMVGEATNDRARLKACAELATEDTWRMLEQPVSQTILAEI